VNDEQILSLSLNAENAKLSAIAAELSSKLKIPVTLSRVMEKQRHRRSSAISCWNRRCNYWLRLFSLITRSTLRREPNLAPWASSYWLTTNLLRRPMRSLRASLRHS
jgi:hypothetical protein